MSKVKRPCIERLPNGRGCPRYVSDDDKAKGKSRCPEHQREYERDRQRSPSSLAIRHDREYHRTRQRWINRLNAGETVVCALCGHVIASRDEFALHHLKDAADGGTSADGLAPAHRSCNARAGQQTGRRSRERRPSPIDRQRAANRLPMPGDYDRDRPTNKQTPPGVGATPDRTSSGTQNTGEKNRAPVVAVFGGGPQEGQKWPLAQRAQGFSAGRRA